MMSLQSVKPVFRPKTAAVPAQGEPNLVDSTEEQAALATAQRQYLSRTFGGIACRAIFEICVQLAWSPVALALPVIFAHRRV